MDFINKMIMARSSAKTAYVFRRSAPAYRSDCPRLTARQPDSDPDEATSALDTESERDSGSVDELQKNRTLVIGYHRLQHHEQADETLQSKMVLSLSAAL